MAGPITSKKNKDKRKSKKGTGKTQALLDAERAQIRALLEEEKAKSAQLEKELEKVNKDDEGEIGRLMDLFTKSGAASAQHQLDYDAMVEHDGDPLFVAPAPPVIDLTATNGKSRRFDGDGDSDEDEDDDDDAGGGDVGDDSDDDGPLFTPAQARELTGETGDGKVVAWGEKGWGRPVIVMYGPKNSAKYKISSASREDDFLKAETKRFGSGYRLGDEKKKKKFVRKWSQFGGICALAYNCNVEELEPLVKVKVDGKFGRLPQPPLLEILVKWVIDGKSKKRWEVRSSIRHLWPSPKKCDDYIYTTACHYAKQHTEWVEGQRPARDASPTPAPQPRGFTQTPLLTVPRPVKQEFGSQGSPAPISDLSQMMDYRSQWCQFNQVNNPDAMDLATQMRFFEAWNAEKQRL